MIAERFNVSHTTISSWAKAARWMHGGAGDGRTGATQQAPDAPLGAAMMAGGGSSPDTGFQAACGRYPAAQSLMAAGWRAAREPFASSQTRDANFAGDHCVSWPGGPGYDGGAGERTTRLWRELTAATKGGGQGQGSNAPPGVGRNYPKDGRHRMADVFSGSRS